MHQKPVDHAQENHVGNQIWMSRQCDSHCETYQKFVISLQGSQAVLRDLTVFEGAQVLVNIHNSTTNSMPTSILLQESIQCH